MCPTATTHLAAVTASMRQLLERGAAVNALNKTLLIDEPQHHCFQKCGWFLELVVSGAARVSRTRAIVIIGEPHCHSSQNCGWFSEFTAQSFSSCRHSAGPKSRWLCLILICYLKLITNHIKIKMWFQLIQIEVANFMRQARFRVAEERAGGADSVVTWWPHHYNLRLCSYWGCRTMTYRFYKRVVHESQCWKLEVEVNNSIHLEEKRWDRAGKASQRSSGSCNAISSI